MRVNALPSNPVKMLLIETRSPWESGDVADFMDLTRSLLVSGAEVHLHLIQNGVLWIQRDQATLNTLGADQADRLLISCDDFSLDQRGVPRSLALSCGSILSMDALVSEMAQAHVKTIWHS